MTCSKTFSVSWYVFFDLHVWVTKPDQANCISFFCGYCRLLASIWVSTRLVVSRKFFSCDAYGHGVLRLRLDILLQKKVKKLWKRWSCSCFIEISANLLSLTTLAASPLMEPTQFLTIAETAKLLNCSAGFVRKRIALTESNQNGGWPKEIFVNLQPNGAKSLYRVNQDALESYLNAQPEEATVEETQVCSVI